MRRLILRSFQSPGDVVMLTAAVRDLHAAWKGQFQTDVRTSADDLWTHNPHLTPLREGDPGVEIHEMHYPLIHQSNQRPYHFLHGYPHHLEQLLQVRIPVTRFAGDIHLSPAEKQLPPPGTDKGVPERYWIVMAGGSTTSRPNGGTRPPTRPSSTIFRGRSRSSNAARRATGTRRSRTSSTWSGRRRCGSSCGWCITPTACCAR